MQDTPDFSLVPISKIAIKREERQRALLDVVHVAELQQSISERGLINPITVDEDLVLIAGECRLTACQQLGWTEIPVRFFYDLSERERHLIELEENVKRKPLTFEEEAAAISKYNELKREENPNWTATDTAREMNIQPYKAVEAIKINNEIQAGNEKIIKAGNFKRAAKIIKHKEDREKASEMDSIVIPGITNEVTADKVPYEIVEGNFNEWSATYTGPKFNFIHCDFPYGINHGKSEQGNSDIHGAYEDGEDVYWQLLDNFIQNQSKFVSNSAHLLFWFSMNFYERTVQRLESAGWTVIPHPLIWHKSDNKGIASDVERRPRHIYETALFASRGDRKIILPISDVVSSPVGQKSHVSEKTQPVLRHFFRMVLDEFSTVLDPTAGSGNSIIVAEEFGVKSALGIELNPEYAERADKSLRSARSLRVMSQGVK